MLETKILTLSDGKLDGDGPGRLSGYASVWSGVDSYGDTIVKGAYKSTIPQFLRDGFIPWSHDWAFPVATPDKAREDEHGLWIEAVFHTDAESQRARQIVAERMDRGKSMGLSIGYQAKGFDFQEIDGQQVRRLLDIELMEVSLVMVPADAAARVAAIKSKRRLSRHQLEAVIATLTALMGDDEEPPDADPAQEAATDEGKSAAPPEPMALDVAGAKLADDLADYLDRVGRASDDDVLAAKASAGGLIRRLGAARAELDALLKRADLTGATHPLELRRQFDHLLALSGHGDTGRRAGWE